VLSCVVVVVVVVAVVERVGKRGYLQQHKKRTARFWAHQAGNDISDAAVN